jgi:hypothetical protein
MHDERAAGCRRKQLHRRHLTPPKNGVFRARKRQEQRFKKGHEFSYATQKSFTWL